MKKSVLSILVVLLFGIGSLFLYCGRQEQAKEPNVVAISISLVEGEITCDPDPAHAKFRDEIQWKSEYPFTVFFGKNSPFEKKNFQGSAKTKNMAGAPVLLHVEEMGNPIRFKYNVAVWDGEKIAIADPELIIDPGK